MGGLGLVGWFGWVGLCRSGLVGWVDLGGLGWQLKLAGCQKISSFFWKASLTNNFGWGQDPH